MHYENGIIRHNYNSMRIINEIPRFLDQANLGSLCVVNKLIIIDNSYISNNFDKKEN